jgi:hypothetical protein
MALTKVGKEGITGISNSSDANAITIDSSEKVGIGQSTPDAELHIGDGSGSSDNTRLRITGGTSGLSTIQFGDTASANIGQLQYDHSSNFLAVRVNAAERMRLLSGGGLTFNGDTAAANALDDYEQGTWTPSVGGSATYTVQAGHYIKIGDMVFITGTLIINNISGAAHTNYLDGLPYNSVAGNGREGFIGVQYFGNLASTGTYFALRTNGDRLYGSAQRENDNTMAINPDIFTNSTEVTFGGSYFVA